MGYSSLERQRKQSGSTGVSLMVGDWDGVIPRQDNHESPSYGWDGFLREELRIHERLWLGPTILGTILG